MPFCSILKIKKKTKQEVNSAENALKSESSVRPADLTIPHNLSKQRAPWSGILRSWNTSLLHIKVALVICLVALTKYLKK